MVELAIVAAPEKQSVENADATFGQGAQKRIRQLLTKIHVLQQQLNAPSEREAAAFQRGYNKGYWFAGVREGIGEKYPDLDSVWEQVLLRIIPRDLLFKMVHLQDGLEATYYLARDKAFCTKLATLRHEEALDRFKDFISHLRALGNIEGSR